MRLFITNYFYLLVMVAFAFLVSCTKNTESTAEQESQKDTIITLKESVVSTNQSELLRLIINPQGSDFGD
ncbi:MAG: hypothetical protein R2822_04380 [Spirosomataceae bacterium]